MLTPEIARRVMAIQAEHQGKLSYPGFCSKMKPGGLEFTAQTIYNWCKALGIKKYKSRSAPPSTRPTAWLAASAPSPVLHWVPRDGQRQHL